ncbi:hypothetical protein [Streptomyces sudanensis]|uniref:hypothetical protein n=1 Tax=Streptomyces sudanensis TaxID=436397 RepID=UPI0020CBFA1F|nr:hypothetical protein [Streptomyces sudanensis]MCP9956884.1 hypothetical protein [Streptomyces sudanensis]MCQ0002532.1 hypothetical protein [Streptomyces sudanensis]
MPAPTFIYILPWLLAASLFVAAEVRDRTSRKHNPRRGAPKSLEIQWISAGIFVGGALIGSILGSMAGSEFRMILVALYTVSSLVVFIALTRLLGRSPGVKTSAMLAVLSAVVSFLLVSMAM